MNVLWVMMAVILEVAVSIRQVPSSVRVTLSLASSWEVTKELVLVRIPVLSCAQTHFERVALSPSSLSLPAPLFSLPSSPRLPLLVCLLTTLSIRRQRVCTKHRQLPAAV